MPHELDDIEKRNAKDHSIDINVLGDGPTVEDGFHYFRCSPRTQQVGSKIVWLLLVSDKNQSRWHYVLVKPDYLKRMFIRGRGKSLACGKSFVDYMCDRCLWGTRSQTSYDLLRAQGTCFKQPPMATTLPKEGENYEYFKNFYKELEVDFFILADFECFLLPCSRASRATSACCTATCRPNSASSSSPHSPTTAATTPTPPPTTST